IDGTSICYRSFFAIKLSTSKGFPTGAIFGFYQTIKKIISQFKPQYMGVCFDVSRKTFRQVKFRDYKIQRPPLPDNLKIQIPIIKKLIQLLGITLIEKDGYEADDLIASITKEALKENFSVMVVTSDKDMYQLLDNDRVKIYNSNRDMLINEESFIKDYGFAPSLIIDFLSLVGDNTDNIPGAKGIGKISASKLIREFGSIEEIFKNLDKVPQKLKLILEREKDNIFLSKDLVKLSYNCDLKLNWKDLLLNQPNNKELFQLFKELEFKSLLKEFSSFKLNLNVNIEELPSLVFLKELAKDLFTFYLDGEFVYIFNPTNNCIYKTQFQNIKDILKNDQIKKISYDFKAQMLLLNEFINGIWFDVKICAYLLNPSLGDYSLSNLVYQYLGNFVQDIPNEVFPYFIYKLYNIFSTKLKEENLEKLFFDIEMPLISILYEMQKYGVKIDIEVMEELLEKLELRLKETTQEIFKIVGREFNLNSPKVLSKVLFEELKIPAIKKIKTGYSTSEDVLEKLAPKYNIAKLLLEFRELNKLKTTYAIPLINEVKNKEGMLYAEFNQTSTQTGRLSSSSPNLQSIPLKGIFSSLLRKAFISSFCNGVLLSADYSQIELRLLAHFSGDEKLKEAFLNDLDIHRYTASLLFKINEEEVSENQRNLAKTINFGIIYGMSAYGLSKELNVSVEEAENFIQDYFLRYPKIKLYIQKTIEEAQEKGYVTTILGRRRYLPDLKSPNMNLREFASRQAINTPIQGSCADIIKLAMIKIYKEIKKKNLRARLIMQIHDELIFDLPKEELNSLLVIVKKNMEESVKLEVPIKVKIKVGKNWSEMEEVL
ncbi:MAG: DNA polymerase I, partial [Candidatus Aenigmatarchaeota archaeon]